MTRSKRSIFIIFFILGLASCASNSVGPFGIGEALRVTSGQDGRACVRTSGIRGYGVRDSSTINISALRNYYIATLRPGCLSLETAPAAAFSSDSYELCGGRMDKIVVHDGQCTVNQVFEFADRDAAFKMYDEAVQWQRSQSPGN